VDGSDKPGSASVHLHGDSSAEERRPVTELYGVFRRPRNDGDRSAGDVAAREGALYFALPEPSRPPSISEEDWHSARLGNVVEAEGRLLLAGIGAEGDMLYAAPTDNDCIALALLPGGSGGCAAPGPDGLELGWHQDETGGLTVFGLVADAVQGVEVVVAGTTHQARMGENAFGLHLERTHEADMERVVLHRRDGTTNGVELGLE
jgi:hypothetical protein